MDLRPDGQLDRGFSSTSIELLGVSKVYCTDDGRPLPALSNTDLKVQGGEFIALLGPSGCGKSTLLRLMAALEAPTTGSILMNGRQPAEMSRAHRLGVAFQDHALLPWLGVAENIALPYRVAGLRVNRDRVQHLIDLVGLSGFEKARPKQLSGGMRQRAAIARALVLKPDLLLLDEPFGALDAVTRRNMNSELQRIWSEAAVTSVLVTHDVSEAVFLADRVVVLSGRPGRIMTIADVEFGRPRQAALLRTESFHQLCDQLTGMLEPDGATGGQS